MAQLTVVFSPTKFSSNPMKCINSWNNNFIISCFFVNIIIFFDLIVTPLTLNAVDILLFNSNILSNDKSSSFSSSDKSRLLSSKEI